MSAGSRPRPVNPGSAPGNGIKGLAARAGRWSAQHRKKAIWGWLAFALIALMVGSMLGTQTQEAAQSGVGESGNAERTIDSELYEASAAGLLARLPRTTRRSRGGN